MEELASNSRLESKWIHAQRDHIFDPENPLSSIGYLISLALFAFFLLADAIIVSSILELIGTISFASVPEILQRLDIAFLGGVVFTILTSVWALVELSGTGGVINSDSMTISQKTLYKWIAVITIFISVILMSSFAVQRLINVNFLVATPAMEMTLSFVLYGLLAVNTFLSAVLVFLPATSGFLVLIYLLFIVIPVFVFFVDIIWRLAYIVIDIVFWILFTPIKVIPYGIRKIFGVISNTAKN